MMSGNDRKPPASPRSRTCESKDREEECLSSKMTKLEISSSASDKQGGGKSETQTSGDKSDLFFVPVEKITTADLTTTKQRKVEVNGESIALISHADKLYAIQEKCPHYGGPLHQGEIEDLPTEGPCIRCPWHSWKFSLDTGKCISPQRDDKVIKIYPVKVSKATKEIKIGFESIADTIAKAITP